MPTPCQASYRACGSMRPQPHIWVRIAVATADDTQGFMMKLPPKTEPVNLGGPNGSIGLLFEFATDPYGTFFKILANAKK